MLKPEFTGQFKKDYKLAVKRGCDPQKLSAVVELLCEEKSLPPAYRSCADQFEKLQGHERVSHSAGLATGV